MREIKFRSAHYTFKDVFSHFSYWGVIDNKGNTSKDCFSSPSSSSSTTRKVEEQYTGLKDKNGKEIYEGDKLFIHGKLAKYCNTEYTVVWGYCGFRVIGKQNIQNQKIPNSHLLEIIGNIHQNLEPLKE